MYFFFGLADKSHFAKMTLFFSFHWFFDEIMFYKLRYQERQAKDNRNEKKKRSQKCPESETAKKEREANMIGGNINFF